MRHTSVNRSGSLSPEASRIDEIVAQIGRLLRHRAYQRDKVVSPLLLRHLPHDSGYAWQGEEALRQRLERAGLDARALDHLALNARTEFARMQERTRA
ncbi:MULTISPECIES: hypothetical protein [Methylobacterium]|uniref:Uncharacterized protein n=1 Tax=Methylobacterium jeotgali TaxID=381630 RepID=A0ABQ4ST91_9HYPH|nr:MULTISPECIES: hypothetical protein [Methylobacterium]PIU05836.1 MAG: hypothetical protein COT56_12955 [Methylobacterium sp. CG09_land_8_20_14_0_10_71_15]PIU13245.1 MAG: hypothetical protein COT28_12125 [Methylobacterium sp. CG08_land_8_20_14_0_20_71_15]GBU19102.1 hypothetical protein AwMethylo_33170 [Methylobacterium sp.]GJE06437.1 hypothetical protein AOPFMNJM_1756 [Methylobacterium jeotgali]